MSQKSGFLIVSNGFFIENVGHTLTKNCNGAYWPLAFIVFKMMTSLNSTNFLVDLNFNTIIKIDIMNLSLHIKFQLHTLFCYQDFQFHVFIIFKAMTSSNSIDFDS